MRNNYKIPDSNLINENLYVFFAKRTIIEQTTPKYYGIGTSKNALHYETQKINGRNKLHFIPL